MLASPVPAADVVQPLQTPDVVHDVQVSIAASILSGTVYDPQVGLVAAAHLVGKVEEQTGSNSRLPATGTTLSDPSIQETAAGNSVFRRKSSFAVVNSLVSTYWRLMRMLDLAVALVRRPCVTSS